VGMYGVTMFGVEVGFHRAFAHRAFNSGPRIRMLLGVCGSMAAQGGIVSWVATHRRHHRHSDTPKDAHSPHWRTTAAGDERLGALRGFWHAQLGHLYSDHVSNSGLFARDVLKDPMLMMVNARYRSWVLLGVAVPTILGAVAYQSAYGALLGFLWGGLMRICIAHHCYFTNGSFSHMFGARPFNTGDRSANNLWCAIPTFGSGLQNNHHAFPSSAQIALHRWEVDIGGYIVNALEALRLIRDVKRVTPEMIAVAKIRAATIEAAPPPFTA
jgi:stearoyl-CoA desaturase (delta-9 desaturase)